MRVIHRYLGFFLAGIMAIYALSGIVLIFRETNFLKRDVLVEKTIDSGLTAAQLGPALRIKGLQVERTEGELFYFKAGSYNAATGAAAYTVKELPLVLDKLTHLHKANTNDPLYFLNISFGLSLLFCRARRF
jgi:hypothetical protein